MKKYQVYLLIILSVLFSRDSFAQSQKSESVITTAMAKKIGYACQYNARVKSIFATSNKLQSYREVEKIISSLDKHLDYAQNFIISLYANYGVEGSFIILKETIGFSVPEIDKVELIWQEEKDQRNIIIEKKSDEKKEKLLKSIEKDELFSEDDLSQKAIVESNLDRSLYYLIFKDLKIKDTYSWSIPFVLLITREGSIEEGDSRNPLPKPIYDFVKNYSYVESAYSKPIEDIKYAVTSHLIVYFNSKSVGKYDNIYVKLIRNKETGKWECSKKVKTINSLKNIVKNGEGLLSDLEYKLNTCPEFADKSKLNLKVTAYERTASSSIDQTEDQYIYFFDIWTKKSPIGEEYIKIISI